jgi:hypothetical protein
LNGICERLHETQLNEFYQLAFRKKIYTTLEELQKGLDDWLWEHNHQPAHSGWRCDGKTPYVTLQEAKALVREKLISA